MTEANMTKGNPFQGPSCAPCFSSIPSKSSQRLKRIERLERSEAIERFEPKAIHRPAINDLIKPL
jgi:hypothetical protein